MKEHVQVRLEDPSDQIFLIIEKSKEKFKRNLTHKPKTDLQRHRTVMTPDSQPPLFCYRWSYRENESFPFPQSLLLVKLPFLCRQSSKDKTKSDVKDGLICKILESQNLVLQYHSVTLYIQAQTSSHMKVNAAFQVSVLSILLSPRDPQMLELYTEMKRLTRFPALIGSDLLVNIETSRKLQKLIVKYEYIVNKQTACSKHKLSKSSYL